MDALDVALSGSAWFAHGIGQATARPRVHARLKVYMIQGLRVLVSGDKVNLTFKAQVNTQPIGNNRTRKKTVKFLLNSELLKFSVFYT